jgi:hypothetical protein
MYNLVIRNFKAEPSPRSFDIRNTRIERALEITNGQSGNLGRTFTCYFANPWRSALRTWVKRVKARNEPSGAGPRQLGSEPLTMGAEPDQTGSARLFANTERVSRARRPLSFNTCQSQNAHVPR